MAGVKGRSGRRPMRDEEKRLKIIDKAWDVINEHLCNESIPTSQKLREAIQIVSKDMPQHIEGGTTNQVVIMNQIKKDEKELRYNIGTADATEDTGRTEEASSADNGI